MTNLPQSSSVVRRRRTARLRVQAVLANLVLLAVAAVVLSGFSMWASRYRSAADATTSGRLQVRAAGFARRGGAVASLVRARDRDIRHFAARYRIDTGLAAAIYDMARAEGLDPALGFQLVKVESDFRPAARSDKGAIGYTQLRLPTARAYDPSLTADDLVERERNLRLGFRFLRDLLRRFEHDIDLALLAYNRGPTRVEAILTEGGDPSNGYADLVRFGIRPKPVVADSVAAKTGL